MTAYHFVLTEIATGRIAGHALICPDARYASVRWRGPDRLDRRLTDGQRWRLVLQELAEGGWPKGAVDSSSAIGHLLIPEEVRGAVSLQFVSAPSIVATPDTTAAELDGYLRAQVLP